MNLSFDVIVVGAGAAGATTAETVASLGSSVLVLEEHNRVGIPSHCSGHVGINSMKRLGISPPEGIIKNQIRGAILHSPSGQSVRFERQDPITWVLDRKAFDEHMATRAEKAGAQIQFNSRAMSIHTHSSEPIQVQVGAGRESRTLKCGLIIDCEGAAPTLTPDRLASERHRSMWINSAQVHVERVNDLDRDMVEIYLGSKYAPGFFAWIIPWRDGSAKVGLATREGNPRFLLERFMTRHLQASRKLKGTKQHDASFHPMPLGGPISKTYYPGMLIVGDSAQQVKPTTGGGIVFSLVCGRAAGEIAHEAIARRDVSESFLSKYERRWKGEIGYDLKVMRAIRRMLFRLPDRQLERIFSVARSLNVGDVLGRADDIDAQGRILARLALDPRLAISLLYSSVLSLPFIMNSREVSARRPHV